MRCTKLVFSFAYIGAFVSAVCLLHAQSKLGSPALPTDTSVSEIVANSDRFNGKEVRLRASFRSDAREHSSLEEPKCAFVDTLKDGDSVDPECKHGLVPWVPDEVEDHPDIKALDSA